MVAIYEVTAYSGDTKWTDSLVAVALGADLFISEAYFYEKKISEDKSVVKIKIDFKCPGIDQNLRAIPQLYCCPQCGADVEIWTDETKGKCPSCKRMIFQEQA